MINYKRSVVAAVVLALFLSLFARGAVAAQKEIKIVASFYPMYIMTRNVAKNVPGVSWRILRLLLPDVCMITRLPRRI